MKNIIFVFLVFVATMIFFGCQEDSALSPVSDQNDQVPASLAKKPAPNLIGTTYTPFTFTPPTFWNGTIDFGVYGKYSITFVSHDAPRDYSQASPFHEDFIIYELGADWTQPETVVYMKGWNAGVVTNANNPPNDPSNFLANGKITEAYGPLEAWQGCNWHIRGLVYWKLDGSGLPDRAEGTVRIN